MMTQRHIPYSPRTELTSQVSLDILVVYLYDSTEKDGHVCFFVHSNDLARVVVTGNGQVTETQALE
jgi:hypothetical protein